MHAPSHLVIIHVITEMPFGEINQADVLSIMINRVSKHVHVNRNTLKEHFKVHFGAWTRFLFCREINFLEHCTLSLGDKYDYVRDQ